MTSRTPIPNGEATKSLRKFKAVARINDTGLKSDTVFKFAFWSEDVEAAQAMVLCQKEIRYAIERGKTIEMAVEEHQPGKGYPVLKSLQKTLERGYAA